MATLPASMPLDELSAVGPTAGGSTWQRRRGMRVIALVGLIVALNLLDLRLTLRGLNEPGFSEANLLMAWLSPAGMIAWKLCAVGGASAVLLILRRRRIVELSCWGLAVVYIVLTALWLTHFGYLLDPRYLAAARPF